jgi:hypothetical protein
MGFELARKLTINGHQVFGTCRATSEEDDTVQQVGFFADVSNAASVGGLKSIPTHQ